MFGASLRLARLIPWRAVEEQWLAVLAIDITLESSIAAVLSFAGWNSPGAYWIVCALALLAWIGLKKPTQPIAPVPQVALLAPLFLLAFKPVEEIDSINYLHYLIDWMANRATPYTFATNYVAFWELGFVPTWMVTGVDLFFPLLALKSVLILALACILVGREFGLRGPLLAWTVFGALVTRHLWYEYSGVPTLKNDVLHGAGFVLLLLVLLRAKRLAAADIALLAFALAFVNVKYTGIFLCALALPLLLWAKRPRLPSARSALPAGAVCLFFLLTSGHYYLHTLLQHGSPFYPFQINLGPIHLPGTADLSYSSIAYNLRDPRLWRALFWPAGGISPMGLLFPLILAAILPVTLWRTVRHRDAAAFFLLCGWLLYFRSVYSACAAPRDLAFILNGLNSVRYVDGALAASELYLIALIARWTWAAAPLLAVNTASRLWLLYSKLPLALFPLWLIAATTLLLFLAARRSLALALACTLLACPFIVERNRVLWTTYWNNVKPSLESIRERQRRPRLAELALEDGGYFAGHVVAAGNPVHPEVRALSPGELAALPAAALPEYLAVMPTPGSAAAATWRSQYGPQLAKLGYRLVVNGTLAAIYRR